MQNKISQALILGAGLGTRLRPLTNTIPKVMVPIAENLPLLEHTVRLLKNQGIKKFIINLHYLPEKIVEHFGNGEKLGMQITYSDETEKLMDTAGAIKKVAHLLDENFLFLYGDEVHFFDFTPAIDLHFKNKSEATVILKKSDYPQHGEVAETDTNGNLLAWHTRPHKIQNLKENFYVNSGLYVLSKKILNYIPENQPSHLDKQIIPALIKNNGRVFGFSTKEEVKDIGTIEKYELAKNWYKSKIKKLFK